jgi:small nuclear ribonucleoprotein
MGAARWAAQRILMALPLDVLERSINKKMSLQLKDGRLIEGTLVGFDQYMNLVLEESSEKHQEQGRRLGTVILRGNNVVTISPQ